MRHDWRRRFFTIWAGQQASLIGSSVAGFALIWWLTTSSGSATVLATASLVSILPGVVLAPFAGVRGDRWNRRRVMVAADSLVAALSLALAVMFWQGQVVVWHVYLVMGARALANSFHWPAMQASTSLLVPEEHLTRISGLNKP
jgi:DHA3 family macrolide efflux protein-like MFS transporter